MARQLKRELSRGRTRNALRWLTVVAALALGVWMGETSPPRLSYTLSVLFSPSRLPAHTLRPSFSLRRDGRHASTVASWPTDRPTCWLDG